MIEEISKDIFNLSENSSVVGICGSGGMGKTAILINMLINSLEENVVYIWFDLNLSFQYKLLDKIEQIKNIYFLKIGSFICDIENMKEIVADVDSKCSNYNISKIVIILDGIENIRTGRKPNELNMFIRSLQNISHRISKILFTDSVEFNKSNYFSFLDVKLFNLLNSKNEYKILKKRNDTHELYYDRRNLNINVNTNIIDKIIRKNKIKNIVSE